jgi:hypothetical protein
MNGTQSNHLLLEGCSYDAGRTLRVNLLKHFGFRRICEASGTCFSNKETTNAKLFEEYCPRLNEKTKVLPWNWNLPRQVFYYAILSRPGYSQMLYCHPNPKMAISRGTEL